jgi:hypothetical protein
MENTAIMRWHGIIIGFVAGWLCAVLLAATPYMGDVARVIGPGTLAQLQTPWGLRTAFAPFWEAWASSGCRLLSTCQY